MTKMENKMKNLVVKLDRLDFSKIRISTSCICTSSKGSINMKCELKQTDVNTFSLTVKRKREDICGDNENPRKKTKLSEHHDANVGLEESSKMGTTTEEISGSYMKVFSKKKCKYRYLYTYCFV